MGSDPDSGGASTSTSVVDSATDGTKTVTTERNPPATTRTKEGPTRTMQTDRNDQNENGTARTSDSARSPTEIETAEPVSEDIEIQAYSGADEGTMRSRERVEITNTSQELFDFSGFGIVIDGNERYTLEPETLLYPGSPIVLYTSGTKRPREILQMDPPIYEIHAGFEGSTLEGTGTIEIIRENGKTLVETKYDVR
jgi:hypothetical protein